MTRGSVAPGGRDNYTLTSPQPLSSPTRGFLGDRRNFPGSFASDAPHAPPERSPARPGRQCPSGRSAVTRRSERRMEITSAVPAAAATRKHTMATLGYRPDGSDHEALR